jgi:hypothetical protein
MASVGEIQDLLTQARASGLPFGVCGGRLWVHISGDQLHLLHLANSLLVREQAVLAVLIDDRSTDDGPGGDHDQPFAFGADPDFEDREWHLLRRLRDRYTTLHSADDRADQP